MEKLFYKKKRTIFIIFCNKIFEILKLEDFQ